MNSLMIGHIDCRMCLPVPSGCKSSFFWKWVMDVKRNQGWVLQLQTARWRNLPKSPQASMRGCSWNLVTSFNVEWIHGCQCSFEFQLQVQVSSFAIFQDVICGGPLVRLPSHCMLPLMAVLRLRTRLMRHYRKRKKKGKSFAQLVGLRCVA